MSGAAPCLPVVATQGSRIMLADGRELIDGVASWWTACHGYNHPQIAAALHDQVARMPHVMFGGLAHEPGYRLAARLARLVPALPHVFFSDSGSVAVEVGMKMAAQYWLNRGVAGRTRFLSFTGGYHGDTFAAMSVCDPDEGMHHRFRGLFPEQLVVDLPIDGITADALDDTLAAHWETLAGVIVEPLVQGAGGMIFHPPAVLQRLRAACDAHHLPLIFDEIFTGFGRTGTMFAMDQAGVAPDIMTVSKALTGGTLGLAATLASPRIYDAFLSDDAGHALMHGPTFMANPLACAAACASLEIFEQRDCLGDVARLSMWLEEGLAPCRGLPGVREVRVRGAIGVVELERLDDATALAARFVERGVWLRPFGRVIALTPAFSISEAEVARLTGEVVKEAVLF